MPTIDQFLSASRDAMIVADASGLILYWNAAAERMFGLPMKVAVGTSFDAIVPKQMRGAHTEGMPRFVGGGRPRVVGTVLKFQRSKSMGGCSPLKCRFPCGAKMVKRGSVPLFGTSVERECLREVASRPVLARSGHSFSRAFPSLGSLRQANNFPFEGHAQVEKSVELTSELPRWWDKSMSTQGAI